MECDICSRKDVAQVGMHCTVCARTAIYGPRLENARLLLEKESLGRKFEQVTSSTLSNNASNDLRVRSRAWQAELRKADLQTVKDRVEASESSRTNYRAEVSQLREEIERKRSGLRQRKKELEFVKQQVPSRQQNIVDKLNQIGNRGIRSFDNINNTTIETRAFLCREAATLLGLRYQKVKDDDGRLHGRFQIAGHVIPDLRYIHNVLETDLTAVLAAVARLVVLISFYVGVRLPAEITLPHRDYPLATITHPATSYLSAKVPFPGSGSNVSLSSSPASSKHEAKALSKPRPLFFGSYRQEHVYEVARKDPKAYVYFLEALSLLAWDITWLGHSQGYTFGRGSWEDACNIGRNLWQLVFAPIQSPLSTRTNLSRDTREQQTGVKYNLSQASGNPKPQSGRLGSHSHDSAHSFLGAASSKDQSRPLKLSKYTMIFDPLRKALEVEMKNADWILLGGEEIDDGEERFNAKNAVNLRVPDMSGNNYNQTRSLMTTTSIDDQNGEAPPGGAREKGTRGWTVLKNRDTPS